MKKSKLLSITFSFLLLASCAKQSTPMGGPRDEDPPILLESNPETQSLNIKPKEITLTFDEFIKLENASKGIVITPRINTDEVEFTALKNIVTIKLNQELEDSTTYVFNFQKSVVDISEENPAENLKLVFSTGDYIDSLSISGTVGNYFPSTKPDFNNVVVGIYPVGDTTDVFTAPPYYLSQADSAGNFSITNIKNGNYMAYALRDLNGTLKAEFKSEEYDFLLDTLVVDKNIKDIIFNLSKADLTPLRILRTGQFGKNFDIILNRAPIETKIENDKLGKDFFYNLSDNRIRIYSKTAIVDSIPFNLSLRDSVGFVQDSLIWAKFEESDRKPDKLQFTANSGKSFYNDLDIELRFTKPIQSINYDSLFIAYDTASVLPIKPSMLEFVDSTKMDLLKIRLAIPDSLKQEIFTIKASDSTFVDVENQQNDQILSANYRKLKRENLADEISGKILGGKPPFIIQLINSKNEVVKEQFLIDSDNYSFKLLEAGTYKIQVVEDLNGNKRWDPANYLQRKNAERVFYFKNEENTQELIIRSGWTRPEQNIQASPATGVLERPNSSVENRD